MLHLTQAQSKALKSWFWPERPGPLIGPHVLQTGHGHILADRWPEPRVVLAETAGNYTLLGDAQAVTPAELQPHLKGFVEASPDFLPVVRATFPELISWPRVIFSQAEASNFAFTGTAILRRLETSDAGLLLQLDSESAWISKTWGGPQGLAHSGLAWGAFVAGKLAAVAGTFFLGETYEDIGVVTEPEFRGLGLSTACAQALCRDIHARGHIPSWSTSTDNAASIRVAEKLGFKLRRNDWLYVVGIGLP